MLGGLLIMRSSAATPGQANLQGKRVRPQVRDLDVCFASLVLKGFRHYLDRQSLLPVELFSQALFGLFHIQNCMRGLR